jgi:hypothetical protein
MPNRILRDYTDSDAVNKLSLGAEVFFIRLMMKADDFGKFHANEKLLKAALFPLKDNVTEKMIGEYLIECSRANLIDWYEVNNRKYLKIRNFGQRLRKMISKFPDCMTNDRQPPSIDSNTPPETETETETETKQNPNPETEVLKNGFFEKSINDELWQESVMRSCKINNPAHWINEFNDHANATQEHYNTIKDWRRHCVNWIKKEILKDNQHDKSNPKDRIDSIREWGERMAAGGGSQ